MLPNVQRTDAADHVPVLAEEVRELLDVQPGETIVDATFGAGGHSRAARRRPRGEREARRDRPRPDRAAVLRPGQGVGPRRADAVPARRLRRRPLAARGQRRPRGRRPARPRPLLDAGRPARARLLVRDRRAARHADGPVGRAERGGRPRDVRRARARDDLPRVRRGAVRAPDRARDRAPSRARSRSSAPGSSSTSSEASIPAPARFGEGHPAKRVFQALRIEVNHELESLEVGASGGVRDAPARRAARRHQLPLARGSDRQALLPRSRAGLHLPARAPRVRLREGAGGSRSSRRSRVRPSPPRSTTTRARARRGCARRCASDVDDRAGRHELLGTARARTAREALLGARAAASSGSCASRVLLAGVVAVNVAVLRLNLQLDEAGRERTELKTDIARLRSEISSAAATTRIERLARGRARARRGRAGGHHLHPARTVRPGGDEPADRRCSPRRSSSSSALALARAVWLQVVKGPEYAAMAVRQHRETVVVPAARGTIVDRNGEPLAIGRLATTVYANPRQVDDARDLTLVAGSTRRSTRRSSIRRSSTARSGFVYVARKADPRKAEEAARSSDFAGLGFYPEELRSYPQGPVARAGPRLRGPRQQGPRGARALARGDARRPAGEPDDRQGPVRPRARRRRDEARDARAGASGSRSTARSRRTRRRCSRRPCAAGAPAAATAVVMDPHTGEVLAMATAPRFNANRFSTTRADRRRNRAVTDTYEPGSTFKLVTIAAGLQEEIVTPRTSFRLAPTIKVADRVIHEAHIRGTERLTVQADRRAARRTSGRSRSPQRLGAGPARILGRPLRVRREDRHRLPRRVAGVRAATRPVVGLDDRHRADRSRHRGDAGPDGARVCGDRQRRRARAPAPHRPHRRAERRGPSAVGVSSRAQSPSR